MSQVDAMSRTASDISTTVHENYINDVKPLLDHLDAVAALFTKIGPGGYTLIGEKLQFAVETSYSGGFMGTDGYIPEHQEVAPQEVYTTPARLYIRRAVDNFLQALAIKPGAYEDFFARLQSQMLDAVQRGTAFHIHGGTAATVCTFVSRTSATILVVDAGYGHAGTAPAMFIEVGMNMALLDADDSYAVIGAQAVSAITYNTSATTATITFGGNIDASSTGADGDPLVFCTIDDTTATSYVAERNYAPLGLMDMLDPDSAATTLLGLSDSTYPRWAPITRASSDFGHIEIMEFMEEISAKGNTEVTAGTHVITMQNGVKIELAKDLLPYVQQNDSMGRTLQGGWKTAKVGEFDAVTSHYHLHDCMYVLCPEDIHVVDLDGEPAVWAGDGSQFNREVDYDGKDWFLRHYVQRFPSRRNRMGTLTGITNPNSSRYNAHPTSS